MARTARAATDGVQSDLSTEDQALMDQMRAEDAAPDDTPAPAPQADTTIAADDAPADDPDAPAGQKPNRMVPLGALHEERERRKALEATVAEERRARQVLEERTNIILQRLGPQQQPAQDQTPQIPDLNTDPVGHITGSIEQVRQQLANLQNQGQLTQQQQQQAAQIQMLQQHAMVREHAFRADNPDYDQAVTFLRKQRDNELEAQGWTDPVQRQALITQEALGMAAMAMQNGRDPAALVYQVAKGRGYTLPTPNGNGAGNGTQQQTPGDRLAQVAAGQQQARGLSGARGSGPAPMTAQRLLEMPDSEFSKMMETEEGRALLGA